MSAVSDIRQSKEWAECLAMYGWKSFRTSKNINIEVLKLGIGGFVKIQKPPALDQQDLVEIERICLENKALFVKIEPGLDQGMGLLKENTYVPSIFILTPTKTIRINLEKDEKQLWNDISHSGKYSINRAKREGCQVKFFENPSNEKLKEFYEVHKETGKKKDFEVRSFLDLKKRTEAFGNNSHLVMVYDKNNVLCGGKFYLGFNKNVWYVYGGTSGKGRKNKTGYLLLWESILHLRKLGYELLDLDGIYDSRFPRFLHAWGGFSHFKEKFGGDVIEFPVPHVKYFNPFLKTISKLSGVNI